MTYEQIINAITEGLVVHWSNTGYIVTINGPHLMVTFTSNSYCSRLQPSEYYKCFVETGSSV